MKKLFGYAALTLAALSFTLASCKTDAEATTPAAETVTLNILAYGDGPTAEDFERICNEFMEKNPNIKIESELLVNEEYHKKAASLLATGNVPDLAYMGADARWGAKWKDAEQQVDNVPYYPSNIDASMVPDFYGTGIKPYLPLGKNNYCSVVAVNTELLKKIGGKLPETYDDMKALATLCKTNDIELMSTHGADDWVWGSCVMSGIIPRTTGDLKWIEKAVNKQVKFTDQEFVDALSVLKTWVDDGVLDPNSVNIDTGTGLANFVKGKYLMYIDGQWDFGEVSLGELSNTVTLISIPPVPGEKYCAGSMASEWQPGYGITKKCASDEKTLDAEKKWLAYFNSDEEVFNRLNTGGISSTILKDFVLPSDINHCIAEKAKLNNYPVCQVIDSYLKGTANDMLNAGMKKIVSGTTTPIDLAASVQDAFDVQ